MYGIISAMNEEMTEIKKIMKNIEEEKIYELQQRKSQLIDNVLDTKVSFISRLSKEDILKLFD